MLSLSKGMLEGNKLVFKTVILRRTGNIIADEEIRNGLQHTTQETKDRPTCTPLHK